MTSQESRRHHFVPEFLLKPWVVDGVLNGFWWDHREGRLSCRRKGAKAFCYDKDLFSAKRHEDGRDVLERKFFGAIDTKSAVARDRLLVEGSTSLDVDQRCDFARLLLSLEARRPVIVHRLREEGSRFLSDSLDSDPEILDAMEREGLSESPSQWSEQHGGPLEDRALANIQYLVDHPNIGQNADSIATGVWFGQVVERIRWCCPIDRSCAFMATIIPMRLGSCRSTRGPYSVPQIRSPPSTTCLRRDS